MTKRMLIDATHPEETRVVVVDGNRLEDFDFESASKQQLKGNIYLARVTRVEPSLQAAFVEYGGNRHGFLAFSEIHPDYYRIPIEDREALLAEERARNADDEEETGTEDGPEAAEPVADADASEDDGDDSAEDGTEEADQDRRRRSRPETVGGTDAIEETPRKRKAPNRRYKIQEVVARRQIMLVQVVKEERGNKGAALTTYLSLAGRYCVLMPNTARGGGVSRKITSAGDRKRLKQVVEGLDVPEGMAVIVRTAGSERTKAEIKRDYEYLLRLWDDIRETTLKSTAPCLIHEEGNLIKRSIRDLYTRDLDEVLVEGEEGYRVAKSFMRTLIPSHAKRVQPYRDPHVPLLHRYQVESQLDAIHNAQVELKSGGYIIINQTEALVAIDVNSGRSTSERNIEETALKTNLEAATEIARQLRLRDLAGLIVIDFIDMEENRNQHAVERRMKEAMKSDRARIQIGRISHFGLMELSRQRLRPSLFETSTILCPHCQGHGYIRSIESTALHVLRTVEEEGLRNRSAEISVKVAASVALYILNQKRERLAEIETRYGFRVMLESDEALVPPDHKVDRLRPKTADERQAFQEGLAQAKDLPSAPEQDLPDDQVDETEDDLAETLGRGGEPSEDEDGQGGRRKRRRRGGRRRSGDREIETAATETSEDGEDEAAASNDRSDDRDSEEDEDGQPRKRRRRGRRGGRRRARRRDDEAIGEARDENSGEIDDEPGSDGSADAEEKRPEAEMTGAPETAETPETAAERATEAVADSEPQEALPAAAATSEADVVVASPDEAEQTPAEKPKRRRRTRKTKTDEAAADTIAETTSETEVSSEAAPQPAPDAATGSTAEAPQDTVPEPAPEDVAVTEDETVSEGLSADETVAGEATSSEAITGETGQDRTVTPDPEGETPEADAGHEDPAHPAIQVQKVEGPAEKPRKGWWRR